MAEVLYYVTYNILYKDRDEYVIACATMGVDARTDGQGSNCFAMAPVQACALLGVPFSVVIPWVGGVPGQWPDKTLSLYPTGPQIGDDLGGFSIGGHQYNSGYILQGNVLSTRVNSSAFSPAFPSHVSHERFRYPTDQIFTWSGSIGLMTPGEIIDGDPVPTPIAQRRWIGGRELPGNFEGGSGMSGTNISLDASRVLGGHGFRVCGSTPSAAWGRQVDTYRPGLTPQTSWERFYFRVRKLPTTDEVGMWRCKGFTQAQSGFGIKLTTSGDLHGYNINLAGVQTDEGTIFVPELNLWYKLDLFLKYDTNGVGQDGRIRIYINGILVYSFTIDNGVGMNANQYHTISEMGNWISTSDEEAEIDFDDWICSDLPGNVDPVTLDFLDEEYSADWILGSHVRLQWNVVTIENSWTPAGASKGVLNQAFAPLTRVGTSQLQNTASGDSIEGLSDALPIGVMDTPAPVLGAVAAIVSLVSLNSASTDGELGYSVAGGAPVLDTVNQTNVLGLTTVAYLPSGMILPDEISPWSIIHNKSADVNTDTTYMMLSVVEYLGTWGSEDDPMFIDYPGRLGWLHNTKYFNTIWGSSFATPELLVFAVGATYTGNGTYQEIDLPEACHMLFIRSLSGGSMFTFFGAGLGAHPGATERCVPNCRMFYDPLTETYKFSVTGATGSMNVSGEIYQYIAFCDPGMRFNYCGVFGHSSGVSSPQINPLVVSNFLADGGFVQTEWLNTVSTSNGLWFRGPGTPATQADPLIGVAALADGMSFAEGVLNTYLDLHSYDNSFATNYSLWRMADSGGFCNSVMVQIVSYIGDGTSSRIVVLAPFSDRYPLYVLVVGAGAVGSAFFRDPSHTGTNSSAFNTNSNTTSAIIGVGIDEITVGLSANANGIPYNVFAICGDTEGMNNGVFIPGLCAGPPDPWLEPDPVEGDIILLTDGGLILGGEIPTTLMKDVSGIYTIVKDLHHDELIDRQPEQASINVEIPDPTWKTGYVGG